MPPMRVDCCCLFGESTCALTFAGDDVATLLDAAVLHAVSNHGHEDTAELRRVTRDRLERLLSGTPEKRLNEAIGRGVVGGT